jgi:hypothetical protein
MTRLRSIPCGRSGLSKGSSPLAMRSVHSAKFAIARSPSRRLMSRAMSACALPERRRWRHASCELPLPIFMKSSGTLRIPGVPSAWHDWQAPCLIVVSHCCWLCTGPSGNSVAAGTLSIENQYIEG